MGLVHAEGTPNKLYKVQTLTQLTCLHEMVNCVKNFVFQGKIPLGYIKIMILRYFEYKIYACLARDEVRQNFLMGSSKCKG